MKIEQTKNIDLLVLLTIILGVILIAITTIVTSYLTKAIQSPYKFEADCNTGFVGIDFVMDYKNQAYKYTKWGGLSAVEHNTTGYDLEELPKHLKIKNIDGLNCHVELSGSISIKQLLELKTLERENLEREK